MSNIPDNNRPERKAEIGPTEKVFPKNEPVSREEIRSLEADLSDVGVATIDVEILVDPPVAAAGDSFDCGCLDAVREAVIAAAGLRKFQRGNIGVRLTDDPTIHQLNRQFIGHDYPTDVISFGYQNAPPTIEGEMVISVDTARRKAAEMGWAARNELILYAVHGTLHISGMDDQVSEERAEMRRAEHEVLVGMGIAEIETRGADTIGSCQAEELA